MAVYQGARPRADAMPPAGASVRHARAASPAPLVTSHRVRPMGALMAVIVGVTMLGLVYLTQTLGSAATGTDIFWTEKDSDKNWSDTRSLQIQILKLTEPETVIPKAKKQNLKRLDEPVVLTAP